MIDYNATLKRFFAEVIKYLEKLQKRAGDDAQSHNIKAAIDVVKRTAANPEKFADYNMRVKEGMEYDHIVQGFIPAGTFDNSAYLTYSAVVNSMGDLNSQFEYAVAQARQKLLTALKTMKYKNSTNMFKDLTFAFKSPKSFAVQSTRQYEI